MKGKSGAALWLTVALLLLGGQRIVPVVVAMMADYLEATDYMTYDVDGSTGDVGEITKEDLYEAAMLQQQIDETERQQQQTQRHQQRSKTAAQHVGTQVLTEPTAAIERPQQQHMELPIAHMPLSAVKQQQQDGIVRHLSESSVELTALSDEDYMSDAAMRLPEVNETPPQQQQQRQMQAPSASVSEYVQRKGKSDQLPQATKADANASNSDHVYDEADADALSFYKSKQEQRKYHHYNNNNNNNNHGEPDYSMDEGERADRRLDEQAAPLSLPQQQLLPDSKQKLPHRHHQQYQRKQFATSMEGTAVDDNEDYYTDSHESVEQGYAAAPSRAPSPAGSDGLESEKLAGVATTLPPSAFQPHAYDYNNNHNNNSMPIARASIPLPFSSVYRTTAPQPARAVATSTELSTIPTTTETTSTTTQSTTTTSSITTTAATAREIQDFTTTSQYNTIDIAAVALADGAFVTPLIPTPTTTPATTITTMATAIVKSTQTTTTTAADSTPTTTLRPAGKQGKQINITRRKLRAHEQLRNYIEDAYIRMPLAVIVDPSASTLEKTKALWHDALRTNFNIKIVLVSLNATGIPAAYNFNNTRQFLAGLNSIKKHNGGDAFIGILHATELVPYDSAIFISTALVPPHTELVQDAAITLLKKRIRLYVIWYGERAASENETQEAVGGILGEVAIRSGGEILHIVGGENSQELAGSSTLTLVADAFRGSQEVDLPVDTTLSNLHVKIDAPMRIAAMETPNGAINLKRFVKFKSHIVSWDADDKRLDAYVPLNKLRKAAVYQLRLVPESLKDEYSVFVRADRKADVFLDDMIKRFDSYFFDGYDAYSTKLGNTLLHSITAGSLPRNDNSGPISTHSDLRFPITGDELHNDKDEYNDTNNAVGIGTIESAAPKQDVETFSEKEINSPAPPATGNATATPALPSQRSTNMFLNGVTKIEMGPQSQLLVSPGQMAQLYFEVTNTRSEPIHHNIQVVDERRFLLRLVPQQLYLRPDEMATVQVTVLVPTNTVGTTDAITFSLHGGASTTPTLALKLKVLNAAESKDTTAPTMSWTFGNRCENIGSDSSSCAERFWTMDITVQDWESGVLRLQTIPAAGLINLNSYTVGTTEELRATYVASCCEPKVALVAYDLAANQRTYSVDVRSIYLSNAAIVAVALGVLLLVLLIALAVWGIVWCCRRRKVSLDLPTYRSHSTRSME